MSNTFYWYPNCSTCRKAKKWLEEHNVEFTAVHLVEETPTKDEILKWMEIADFEPRKFFNTSGQVYRENNLKELIPTATEEEMAELLAGNGMLIKRPVLTNGKQITIGFKEIEYEKWRQ